MQVARERALRSLWLLSRLAFSVELANNAGSASRQASEEIIFLVGFVCAEWFVLDVRLRCLS